jgi:hypothetical protein
VLAGNIEPLGHLDELRQGWLRGIQQLLRPGK